MSRATPIWTDVDYERDGKQVGWLALPHSVTRSAYGTLRIPVACLKHGTGRTVLLMAGNHGDEYEGQIALSRFIRETEAEQIQGRIIVLPAANLPAVMAGARVSPIDQGNLNRAFGGDPERGPTWAIAHYVETVLFPLADLFHDFHAGGTSLHYLPFASIRLSGDPALDRAAYAAVRAFAPPLAQVWAFTPDQRLSTAAANRCRVVSLGGEFGGGGSVSIEGLRLIGHGLRRLLAHLEVMAAPADLPPPPATRFVEVRDRSCYVYAPDPGVFEPLVELGQSVTAGQPAAWVHFVDDPARPPALARFAQDGLVVCRRAMGRCERGDCLFHLATDVTPPPAA
jgi:predicted deacylase